MKLIPLTQGYFAMVDDADYDRVSRYQWCAYVARCTVYAGRAATKECPFISMHRFIMDAGEFPQIDHRNRCGWDNRRRNLRPCTRSQNLANRNCRSRLTGYMGVTIDRGKFKAHVEVGGRHYSLGRFETAEEAARVRDAAAVFHWGEFANLNLPDVPIDFSLIPQPDPERRMRSLKLPAVCDSCGKTFTVAGFGQHRQACLRRTALS